MTNSNDNDNDKNPSDLPAHDSTVGDWFGQSVAEDAELADRLTDELGGEEAEKAFDEQAEGRETQERRHGSEIDPDQGISEYRDQQ